MKSFKVMLKKSFKKFSIGDIFTVVEVHFNNEKVYYELAEIPPIIDHEKKAILLQCVPDIFFETISDKELIELKNVISNFH
jgi:hemerythrin